MGVGGAPRHATACLYVKPAGTPWGACCKVLLALRAAKRRACIERSGLCQVDCIQMPARADHFVAFCSTPGQEPLVRARVAVEELIVRETDSLARS